MFLRRVSLFVALPLLLLAGSHSGVAKAQSHTGGSGLTSITVNDPAYNMKAYTVSIPAGWKLQGIILPGPGCAQSPSLVYRAYSPDGLSEMRLLPAFSWTFHPSMHTFHGVNGCLNYTGPISAADFLQKYEEIIAGNGIHVVGPMNVGDSFQARTARIAQNMNHIAPTLHGSSDAAAVRVETRNGSFVIEQRLRVHVDCRVSSSPMDLNAGTCSAFVDVDRAPKGKLDTLCALIDAHNLVNAQYDSAWLQSVLQAQRAEADRIDKYFGGIRAEGEREQAAANAMLLQQHNDFMATSQRNHEAFMAQQDSKFHSSMNAANASMNARTTAASDWVDYSLDQQTVVGQGGYAKVSNAYNQTWSSTVGGQTTWYQTNNPNADPNGVLSGNWTPTVKVHGNGQPY